MEVIGRVESGTETESNAGAVAEDVRSEKAPRQLLHCSNKLHPCSDTIPTFPPSMAVVCHGRMDLGIPLWGAQRSGGSMIAC